MPILPLVALSLLLSGSDVPKPGTLERLINAKLPSLGHRNWIVVADSAYPLQTAAGIETVTFKIDHLTAVTQVISALKATKHVRPVIYVDRELEFVPESRIPGIAKFRQSLSQALSGMNPTTLLHEEIIAKLDEAGKTFEVLVIKTPHLQPYTSVFFQLECGYWSADAEKELRHAMGGGR